MQTVFDNCSWIWYTPNAFADSYGDFQDHFCYSEGQVLFRVSCDGDYTLFVNGHYAASNQYGDFEHYKIYDTIDITPYLIPGENKIFVTVWHLGIPSSRYQPAKAGLLYEVECGGNILCRSGCHTLSRENPHYKSGYGKIITDQLGQSFLYDATQPSDTPFHNSFSVEKTCVLYPRPIQKLCVREEKPISVLKAEGCHFLLDLGEECVGLPTLRFSSDAPQKITLCWGEHIFDGGVCRKLGYRDFSFEYIAAEGQNQYTNYMLRLGCRYLEVFCEQPIQVDYIGLLPQEYPVAINDARLNTPQKQQIYDLCVRTLKLCILEHYVDTPWREQSLYAYDARNQMLCGYRAFKNGNREYARAMLTLIGQDRREDGLLSITYPCGTDLAIPSFSLHYITAVKEYLDYTNDLSLGHEVYEKLLSIIRIFEERLQNGLLYSFAEPHYWNFYDWTPHMREKIHSTVSKPDLMLNCLFLIALKNMKSISDRLGKSFAYQSVAETVISQSRKFFYDPVSGLFSAEADTPAFTELGNGAAILADLATAEEAHAIAEKLAGSSLIPCSLSMKCFVYDALLKVSRDYHPIIVEDICNTYQIMLDDGATSAWEIIDKHAFDNAVSRCHGWSALPILYLES